jgi:hypothetical protein
MTDKVLDWAKDRLELILVLLTMIGMFTTGVWWTSKLDSRLAVVEEWKAEAKPIVSKMNVFEFRIQRQYEILQRIELGLSDMQKALLNHVGRDQVYDKSKVGVQ